MADRDTGTQHKLRLPVELKEKIAESAKAHNRSMNADIVARLEQSFKTQPSALDLLNAVDTNQEPVLALQLSRLILEFIESQKAQKGDKSAT